MTNTAEILKNSRCSIILSGNIAAILGPRVWALYQVIGLQNLAAPEGGHCQYRSYFKTTLMSIVPPDL